MAGDTDQQQRDSELTALVRRLESIRSRLPKEADPVALDAEIAAALDEVREGRKRFEERIDARTRALRESYARLETVLQQLPEGALIINASGKLELANRRAEELLGRTFDEIDASLRERTWMLGADATGPEQPVRDVLERVAVGARSLGGRFRYVNPKGEKLMLEASAAPVRTEAGVTSVVMTFQDVTARERRERAERDFVTNAAHELQTPIAAISSAVDVLQAGAKRRASDRDHFLSHVEAACRRLERLTRALLVLARAQMRAEAPRRELIAVGPLLESIARGLSTDSTLEVRCDADLAVIANRPLLEQALESLGQNALKHAEGPIMFAGGRESGAVVIRVHDAGNGIPVVDRDRIFERFYRASDSPVEGFGLGLAIVSEAIAALDGELDLDTSPDGTAITIRLPAATLLQP